MSKKMRMVNVTHCVACHKSNTMLRKFVKTDDGHQLMICDRCHKLLISGNVVGIAGTTKSMEIANGELVFNEMVAE